jgi:hypothetical protein
MRSWHQAFGVLAKGQHIGMLGVYGGVTETSRVQTNALEREKENYAEKNTEMMRGLNSWPSLSFNWQRCNARDNSNYSVAS